MRGTRWTLAALILGLVVASARAHEPDPSAPSPPPERPRSLHITMEQLHRSGGVPPGWKFTLPPGNPVAGRKVFVDFDCYTCHEVKGAQFPTGPGEKRDVGPELTGMGAAHPAEFLAEAIVNPNAVIIDAPGFTGPDGLSKMPSYNEHMTVVQLIDLVAYLLPGGHRQRAPEAAAGAPSPHDH